MDPVHPRTRRTSPLGAVRAAVARLAARLVADEDGTTHFEYALIAVFTGTALIAGLVVLRGGLENFYTNLAALLDAVR
jgi:Flp pilus assembly pilin Flp